MPYCAYCGVEVDNGVRQCPLCIQSIPVITHDVVHDRRFPEVSHLSNTHDYRYTRKSVLSGGTVVLLVVLLITLGIDFFVSGSLTWSLWLLLSIVLMDILMISLLFLYPAVLPLLLCNGGALILFLWGAESLSGGDWFLRLGLPVAITTSLCCAGVALVYQARGQRWLFFFVAILGSITLISLVTDWCVSLVLNDTGALFWSLIVSASLVPILGLALVYELALKRNSIFRRYFHL